MLCSFHVLSSSAAKKTQQKVTDSPNVKVPDLTPKSNPNELNPEDTTQYEPLVVCENIELYHTDPKHWCGYVFPRAIKEYGYIPNATACFERVENLHPTQFALGYALAHCKKEILETRMNTDESLYMAYIKANPGAPTTFPLPLPLPPVRYMYSALFQNTLTTGLLLLLPFSPCNIPSPAPQRLPLLFSAFPLSPLHRTVHPPSPLPLNQTQTQTQNKHKNSPSGGRKRLGRNPGILHDRPSPFIIRSPPSIPP